ncbi:uncharacterized protein LOC106670860 [Cimex lectularius]|uniref:Uncharacterized protein n=1 Tax=Cimex lectularius TaxID=79782 RepID=A0A8I6S738_CIMLE|nr:uncharacterized protein LOC106670860 [Cimex lectularius]XP_014257001.1 uncharacterized protein LOC106670860 [Cimex lectularius]
MGSKRIEFLNKLRDSVYKDGPSTSCSTERRKSCISACDKKSSNDTATENSSNFILTELYLSSDDSDVDPNFLPNETITDSDTEVDEDSPKQYSKGKTTPTNTKATSVFGGGSHATVNPQPELLAPIEAIDSSQPAIPVAVDFTHNDNNNMIIAVSSSISNNVNCSESPKKRYKADPSKWKRNINRSLRLSGQSYMTVKGKLIPAKPMQVANCVNRRGHNGCLEIPEEGRQEIYNNFHSLKTLKDQREFFIRNIQVNDPKRTVSGISRNLKTSVYELTFNNEKYTVCREFFLRTLGISEGLVRGAFKKLNSNGFLDPENRGRKQGFNEAQINFIKEHIKAFPAVQSHYCRKSSEFKYLSSELNIRTMYNLYKEKCQEQNQKPGCFETYRKVFRTYKLTFHKPKKDLCKTCVKFNESSENEQEQNQAAHNGHLGRADSARIRRDEDKKSRG